MRTFIRFLVFCALAAAITSYIAPFNLKNLFTMPTAPPTAGRATSGPVAHSITHTAPVRQASANQASPTASIRLVQDSTGTHWVVNAGRAYMRTDQTGSQVSLSFDNAGVAHEFIGPLRARTNALREQSDPTFKLTKDQIERLKGVPVKLGVSATNEDRAVMRQAWRDYQSAQANTTLSANAKKAAEAQLAQKLLQVDDAVRTAARQRQLDAVDQIQKILTPEQLAALSSRRPTTRRSAQ
jgi:hypothetical protein